MGLQSRRSLLLLALVADDTAQDCRQQQANMATANTDALGMANSAASASATLTGTFMRVGRL